MSSVDTVLEGWLGAPRPLKELTKVQLFKYLDADPSDEGNFKWAREILTRHQAFVSMERTVARARLAMETAERRLGAAQVTETKERDRARQAKETDDTVLMAAGRDRLAAAAAGIKSAERYLAQTKVDLAAAEERAKAGPEHDQVVSTEEIHKYHRIRYGNDWQQVLADFAQGRIFTCDSFGWYSFLQVTDSEHAADVQTYHRVRGLAFLVGEEKGPAMEALNAFYQVRVMAPPSARRIYLSDDGSSLAVGSLPPAVKRRYWQWWRAYNTATFRNKWKDSSGVAYDTVQFNPDLLSNEERAYA